MLPALASLDDLNVRLPEPAEEDADEARAQAALDDASTLVRLTTGQSYVDEDEELIDSIPDVVVVVTLAAARRAYLNPDDVRQESVGPYSVTLAGTGVYLTDDEKALLSPADTVRGLSSVRVAAPQQAAPSYWLHDPDEECV